MTSPRFLALIAAFAVAAGCSSSAPSGRTPPSGAQAQPHVLRLLAVGDISGANPLARSSAAGTDLDLLVYGYFFELDDKLRYVPDLATEVPSRENGGISADGLTLTYHLRKGVKWQDGTPFTARDVVFTTDAIMKTPHAAAAGGWNDIASVEAVGDDAVRFHLKKLYAPAISTFFCESGQYPVLSAHALAKVADISTARFDHPVGTGPFEIVRWTAGKSIVLAANPSYWRGKPKLDGVEYLIVPDQAAALAMLQDRQADAWLRAPSALYDELKRIPGYRVQASPTLSYAHLDLNQESRQLDDLRVRRAIGYAIDRDAVAAKVGGAGADPAWSDISPLSWAYDDKTKQPKPDPARARALLKSAGWMPAPGNTLRKDGQTLAFALSTAADSPTAQAIEALLQQELRGIGIEATTKDYPSPQFFASIGAGGIVQSGKYDAALFSWTAGADPDDSAEYVCDQIPPKGQNDLYWCDDKMDAAERGALSTYDRTVRKRYYSVTQAELASQAATIVLYFERQATVTSADMRGFVPAPSTSNNWNSWEWSI